MKIIFLTGATDGIGFEAAKQLAAKGHKLLIHGRSETKLENSAKILSEISRKEIETFRADLSILSDVEAMCRTITRKHDKIDVIINNAGVFKTEKTRTKDGYDVRFIVNLVAPYLLTKRLLKLVPPSGRVINLSSAAQAPVDHEALAGNHPLADNPAYAQSKLGMTMWSFHLAKQLGKDGPAVIALNPASFIGTKMVKEAYGMDGKDLSIGSDIIVHAALSDEFKEASGQYYDNDNGCFAPPHPDAQNAQKNAQLVAAIEALLAQQPKA